MSLLVNLLSRRRQFLLKSQGISMLPLLRPDDVLFFRRVQFSRIKVNDLMLIKKKRHVFTHRVIYKSSDYLISRGDNNYISDGKIYPYKIIGKVYQVKRNGQMINIENLYLLQSTLYFQEIVKIKQAFDKERVNYVFLKGLPLHLYFGKTHPRRIYADCDVLINKKDATKVGIILSGHGYIKADASLSKIHKMLKKKEIETSFYKLIDGFPVVFDIHYEISSFLSPQLGKLEALYPQRLVNEMTEQFLKEKKSVRIQKEAFPILSPVNLIIYLSLHFFHHNYRGIFMLDSLSKIVQRYKNRLRKEMQDELTDKVRYFKLQNFVYPSFVLLNKYFPESSVPQNILKVIIPEGKTTKYIEKNILTVNNFDDESRIKAGIERFKNIFYLSPFPLIRKILIFFSPAVIYSLIWVIIFLSKRSFTRLSRSFLASSS